MDSSDHQTCAICLENLLPREAAKTSSSSSSQPKIGAVVPCGHVFHYSCYKRWYSAQRKRIKENLAAAASRGSTLNDDDEKCKCPMCNVPCQDFVKLFMGEASASPGGKTTGLTEEDMLVEGSTITATASTTTDSILGMDDDSESIVLLARTCHDSAKRLDRVKDKLKQYKKDNRALEKKLEDERRHMESTLERSVERHAKERRSWKRQQTRLQEEVKAEKDASAVLKTELEKLKSDGENERRKWKKHYKKLETKVEEELKATVAKHEERCHEWEEEKTALENSLQATKRANDAMQQEIDRTAELQVEERRKWEQQQKQLQAELDQAREDKAKAEAKVQKAVQGIAQMRVYHEIRKDQMDQLVKEKARLEQEITKMKEAAELTEEVLFD